MGNHRILPRPRTTLWEYPTAADRLMGKVDSGGRIVDIGAGVNPLVPYLAARGYEVDTVDPSPQNPGVAAQAGLDRMGIPRLRRHRHGPKVVELPARRTARRSKFDAAYSISVIEHLTAADREALLLAIAERVRTGGVVILTVDLAREQQRPVEPGPRPVRSNRSVITGPCAAWSEKSSRSVSRLATSRPSATGVMYPSTSGCSSCAERGATGQASPGTHCSRLVRPQLASVAHKAVSRVRSRLH